jgi:hypothetical protein
MTENTTGDPIRPAVAGEKDDSSNSDTTLSEGIKTIGGLLAVIAGVIVVAVIAAAAISKNSQTAATIAGSTTGAVATMVGAYFGVKIGTDQTKQALDAADRHAKTATKEAAKAQVYALEVPVDRADAVRNAAADAADAA